MKMEIEIHSLILRKAGNIRLIQMIESIKDLIHRERVLSLQSSENIDESFKEHQQLANAMARKDAKLAGRTMRSHIVAVKKRMLGFLELPDE
jgi:DNA-binding FadR family transcriptional regulator